MWHEGAGGGGGGGSACVYTVQVELYHWCVHCMVEPYGGRLCSIMADANVQMPKPLLSYSTLSHLPRVVPICSCVVNPFGLHGSTNTYKVCYMVGHYVKLYKNFTTM